ncbi:MAG: N-acetylglucosamine kinase [Zunongwangia sp.]|jgi:N-acetylglucosamine kinase-like BadF-type ATPase|nr:N-acetylglucosamine kinase [Zunongwangia profunda]MAC64443.1 N-acetylglucosamine kinase [Flavobacteriaceae bacterium]MAO36885.1 N-acetylglucosamine kinase [Zunongwangia sp.]MAG88252.1 N-acetylglucosamine kinase [Flavobacteriaceae bacterium]MAS69421.1 N-acetylglucosamine kinase [Zunongwangia sp.]MCC4227802.1 N-acetylglucosamine kinase [Zunongwangia profunda]|tara:strand:+ start:162 stop:1019 length:858 start_codon:yes stop_codon:yes gene_type:complete
MILIADGGSTKCDWILMDSTGEKIFKTRTKGLNPAVFPEIVLEQRIEENPDLREVKDKVERVHFFGAGCGTEKPSKLLAGIIANFFTNADDVMVKEDMVAAVYAATTEPGIVCILGTGSNSCYFDGENIHQAVASLGYILMDEASGNYFGKRLIRDYYYKRMPPELAVKFEEKFDLSSDEIKKNIYQKENPNTYLASFAEFIFANERNGYFYKLVHEGLTDFVHSRVLCYPECRTVPVHFIGTIAYFSEDIIRAVLQPYGIEVGNIVRRPIDALVEHYRKNVLTA